MKIRINGNGYECEKGETLLEVARRAGIYIPTLCHSRALPGLGSCRVCITEVVEDGWSRMVTACIFPLQRECEVFTESERVKRQRGMVLALLHKRAPQSPEIAQMCKYFGAPEWDRLPALEADKAEAPGLVTEKCILCGLCAKACAELGTGAITTALRGTEKRVCTPYDDASADCIGCTSCARICPTKAIGVEETEQTLTIWHRAFEKQFCTRCGAYMGTGAEVAYAANKAGGEIPTLCEECRRKAMTDVMAKAYGH